jgi:hypothetical protein
MSHAPVDGRLSRLPGTYIQNAFLKLHFEYYWEIVFEMCAPNVARHLSRLMQHFLNFLPRRGRWALDVTNTRL